VYLHNILQHILARCLKTVNRTVKSQCWTQRKPGATHNSSQYPTHPCWLYFWRTCYFFVKSESSFFSIAAILTPINVAARRSICLYCTPQSHAANTFDVHSKLDNCNSLISIAPSAFHVLQASRILLSCHTLCPKKHVTTFSIIKIVGEKFNNKCPITIIFGIVSSKSMRHQKMVSFPTSPI